MSATSGPRVLDWYVPRDPSGVGMGRMHLQRLGGLPADVQYDVALMLSELLTNSVRYGAGDQVRVLVALDVRRVRVEVTDSGPTLPAQREAGEFATSGRGLTIVAALALAWGVLEHPPAGKTVWFEAAW